MTAQTGWEPTVGARALVDFGGPERFGLCLALRAGDIVTTERLVGGDWVCSADEQRQGYVSPRHLRPVPADQPDPGIACRGQHHYGAAPVGTNHNGCTFHGADQPDPAQDTGPEQWRISGLTDFLVRDEQGDVLAMFHRPEYAARAVAAVNAEAGLRAEVERFRRELRSANRDLATKKAERDAARAERDAARAELAAAHAHDTDGLALPEVGRVTRVPHGVGLLCDNALYDGDRGAGHWQHEARKALLRHARYSALAAFVADEERARLADEATPDKAGA